MFLTTILPLSLIGIVDIVILSVIVRAYVRRQRGEKLGREESPLNLFSLLIVYNGGMATAMFIS